MGMYETTKKIMAQYFQLYPTNTERFDKRIDNLIETNKHKGKPQTPQSDKRKFQDFVQLSDKEYNELCVLYGDYNTKKIINDLNKYIGSKGDEYKSHFWTIRGRADKSGLKPPKAKAVAQQEVINEMSESEKEEVKRKLTEWRKGFAMPV